METSPEGSLALDVNQKMLNVKSATRPDRDKQANVRDSNDVAKHTKVKSMLTVKSALTTVHMP